MMKRNRRKGFTIIEVALFLAISGAIFVMIMVGTTARVERRRYEDALNDLAEELRNAYSSTINVENYRRSTEDSSFFCSITSAFNNTTLEKNSETGNDDIKTDNNPGRTRCAVYGQVITFGENDSTMIHRYDIIGLAKTDNLEPKGLDDVLLSLGDGIAADGSLAGVKANIVTIKNLDDKANYCNIGLAGTTSTYLPQWDARVENKGNRELYRGAVMIARSPLSGTIHTYIYSDHFNPEEDNTVSNADFPFNVQKWISSMSTKQCGSFSGEANKFVKQIIDEGKWIKTKSDGSETHMDICVGSDDLPSVGNRRRAIRIHGDGSTESAVEIMSEIDSNAICRI